MVIERILLKLLLFLTLFSFLTSCLEPVPVEEVPEEGPVNSLSDDTTDNSGNSNGGNNSSGNNGSTNNNTNVVTEGEDPLLAFQWHLDNTGSNPILDTSDNNTFDGVAGEDLNIKELYESGAKGSGVTISVVDDGLEINHPDLAPNVNQSLSFNYLNNSTDPTPQQDFGHGTACAGIIAARDNNDEGIRGVAPRSTLVGYNLIASYQSSRALDAMTRNKNVVQVSSNSWGPADGFGDFFDPDPIWLSGVKDGIATGRNGKGIVYVWAAGNGGNGADISNYDGFASQEGVMAVAAIGNTGRFADYSEYGSNIWVAAPSMGNNDEGIVTTDLRGSSRGYNISSDGVGDFSDRDYTNSFNGTSAATPMVSGVAALILEANPNLNYRDVKAIIAKSARKNDPSNINWDTNSAGIDYNYNYGFGAVDAQAAVNVAKFWTSYPTQITESWPTSGNQTVNTTIDDVGNQVSSSINVSGSSINQIEFVEVELNMDHNDWGNVEVILERNGSTTTSSILAVAHPCINSSFTAVVNCTKSNDSFTFGVAKHFEEDPDATWTLKIRDAEAANAISNSNTTDGESGTFISWRIKFYGH